MTQKVYKTKLKIKNRKVSEDLKKLAGIYRKFYNCALDYQVDYCIGLYDHDCEYLRNPGVRFRTGTQVADYLREMRQKLSYAKKVDSGIMLKAAFTASGSYLRAWKYKIPKYMSRKKGDIRFKTNSIKVFYDYVKIPKFGEIELCEKGYIPQGKKYSDITFSFDGKDWWLSLLVEEEHKKETELTGSLSVDFDYQGNLLVNGEKFVANISASNKYKRVNTLYKKACQKYLRQVRKNTVISDSLKPVCRASRNMMKTRVKVQLLSNRLKHMKKDYIKKAVSKLAKIKPLNVLTLSTSAVKKYRNNYSSRKLRENKVPEFFSSILKNLALFGSNIIRCNNPKQLLSVS